MASTGRSSGGALRAIQKKLRAVVKTLLQRQEIHDMLEAIDESNRPPEMGFLFDDSSITEYGDDIARFKGDAEVAFKAFSRLRGRSRDSNELHQYFLQLIKEQIEDEVSGGGDNDETASAAADRAAKKRGRSSDAAEGAAGVDDPAKKKFGKARKDASEEGDDNVVEMTTAQRNALKNVVKALMKHEVSEPFLYPVDSRVFPEYYEVIKKPMDLHTAQEKIAAGEFETVESAVAALKLIWGNCRKFNAEGSEISGWADEMEAYMNDLVEEKLGSEFVRRGRKSTSGKASEKDNKEKEKEKESAATSSSSATAAAATAAKPKKPKSKEEQFIDLSRKALRSILSEAKSSKFSGPFLLPVDLDEAPGYLDVVSQPMDVSTMESKLKSGAYDDDTRAFIADMKLISANCLAYNDPESEIAKWAVKFGQEFEAAYNSAARDAATAAAAAAAAAAKAEKSEKSDKNEDDTGGGNLSSRASALASALAPKRIDLGTTGKTLFKIWKEISKDERSEPFRLPVDVSAVPGYTDIVKTPMDLSTIRGQLETYEYSPIRFLRDLRLVFDNCMAFNEPGSQIYSWAEQLKAMAEELYASSFSNDSTAKKSSSAAGATSAAPPAAAVSAPAPAPAAAAAAAPAAAASVKTAAPEAKTVAKTAVGAPTKVSAAVKVEPKPTVPAASLVKPTVPSGAATFTATSMSLGTVAAFNKTPTFSGGPASIQPLPTVTMTSMSKFLAQNPYTTMSMGAAYAYGIPVPAPVPAPSPPIHIYTPHEVPIPLTPVTAVVPVNRSSASLIPSSISKLDKPLHELERFLQVLESNRGYANAEVKERAIQKAKDQIPAIATPCLTESGLHEILSFGEIVPNLGFAFQHVIYPRNFSSKRTAKIFIVPKDFSAETATGPLQFLPVEFTSTINAGDPTAPVVAGSKPTFTITVDGGTIVAEGHTPREAWSKALARGDAVLKVIGSKLRRCRAVLYRLCINPLVVDFLEQYPPNAAGGADYYRVITSPMWLREVYNRLNDGSYDNEYDFAWDVRLVFSNCMTYNLPESPLYNAAQALSEEFEHLLCNWVYNVQDHSVDDFAKGAWDDWNYLKYFDAADPKENFCRATSTRTSESELVDCCSCEDQYLKSFTDKGTYRRTKKGPEGDDIPDPDSWICKRCETAQNTPVAASISGVLKPFSFSGISYSREDYGGNFYVPVSDFGVVGWCQARRMRRGGLKNCFLSPLGYEFQSKEEALQHMEFEKTVNDNLLATRASEYKEYELAKKQQRKAKQRSGGHRRSNRAGSKEEGNSDAPAATATATAAAANPAHPPIQEEEGLIYVGKLANFTLAADQRIAFCVTLSPAEKKTIHNAESSAGASAPAAPAAGGKGAGNNIAPASFPVPEGTAEISPTMNLPRLGLFGLEERDVRLAIETLENASSCADYQFTYAAEVRDSLISLVKTEIARSGEKSNLEKRLKAAMCKERWFWERSKMEFKRPGVVASLLNADGEGSADPTIPIPPWTTHKPGFSALFPEHIDSSEGEFLLCLWDFLDIASYVTDPSFALVELVKAITPPESMMPTVNQTIFDELCCQFTTMLLKDFQRGIAQNVCEQDWQDILFVKPLNALTWPFVARCVLLVLRQNFTASEATSVINAPATEHDMMLQDDIICLLLSHPLIHHFTMTGKIDDVISKQSFGADGTRSIYSVRRRCLIEVLGDPDDERNADLIYEDISEFASDLRGVFLDAMATAAAAAAAVQGNKNHDPKYRAAKELLSWLDGLLTRWGVNYEVAEAVEMDEDEDDSDSSPRTELHTLGDPVAEATFSFRSIYMDPFGFNTRYQPHALKDKVKATYERDLKALAAFETTLKLLRSNADPETWSKAERIAVLSTFVDKIAAGYAFKWTVGRPLGPTAKFDLESIADIPDEPAAILPATETVKVTSKMDVKCRYSGAESKVFNDGASKWVNVPDILLSPPLYVSSGPFTASASHTAAVFSSAASTWGDSMEDAVSLSNVPATAATASATAAASEESSVSASEDRRSSRALRVRKPLNKLALDSAYKKIAAAREAAYYHRMKTEVVLAKMVDFLLHRCDFYAQHSPIAMVDTMRPSGDSRTLPLGIDRYGNEYWLFWAQRHMTIELIGDAVAAHSTNDKPLNPCVITREPDGWWGVHSGRDMKSLFDSFSSEYLCEAVLRESMIEHLHYCKKSLYSVTLRFKFMQREWFERQAFVTKVLEANPFTVPEGTETSQAVKLLETYWAKCLESRAYVHTGIFYRLEDDPQERTTRRAEQEAMQRRVRKLRETFAEDILDHHVTKGWLRTDNVAAIRNMYASTTASRIHADPLAAPLILNGLNKSRFLLCHIPESTKGATAVAVAATTAASSTTASASAPAASAASAVAAVLARAPVPAPAATSVPAAAAPATSAPAAAPAAAPATSVPAAASAPATVPLPSVAAAVTVAAPTPAVDAAVPSPTASAATPAVTEASTAAVVVPDVPAVPAAETAASAPVSVSAPAQASAEEVAESKEATAEDDTAMDVDVEKPAEEASPLPDTEIADAGTTLPQAPPQAEGADSVVAASASSQDPNQSDVVDDAQSVTESAAQESPRPSEAPSDIQSEGPTSPRPSEAPSSPRDPSEGATTMANAASSSHATTTASADVAGAGAAAAGTTEDLSSVSVDDMSGYRPFTQSAYPATSPYGGGDDIYSTNYYGQMYNPISGNRAVKAIEQLHIVTGEVLRVYPSGRDAAAFMNVSQSGISLCCTGVKADAYGFKWRFYEGPPLDWDVIKGRQMSLEQLRTMQIIRGKRVHADGPGDGLEEIDFRNKGGRPRKSEVEQFDREISEARAKAAALAATAAKSGVNLPPGGLAYGIGLATPRPPDIIHLPSTQPSTSISRPLPLPSSTAAASTGNSSSGVIAVNLPVSPQLVSSTVMVSARLAKLKSELVSIIYTIPEKSMKFADPEQEKEKEKKDTVAEEAKQDGATESKDETTTAAASAPASADGASAVGATESAAMDVDELKDQPTAEAENVDKKQDRSECEPKKEEPAEGEVAMDVDEQRTESAAAATEGAGECAGEGAKPAAPAAAAADAVSDKKPEEKKEPTKEEETKESKHERKIKRRAKRKANFERILKAIQEAKTPAELFVVFSEIEAAVPPGLRYNISDDALPTNADSCALLATRIFVLDRSIRYAEIKEVDTQGAVRAYRPRTHFVPRCLLSSSCSKLACHIGKCMIEAPATVNNGFRTQDILESTLSVYVEAQRLRQSLSTAQLSALLPPMNGITSGLAAIATAPAPNPQIQQAAAAAAAARKQAALAYAAQITAQARQALLAKTLRAEENEEELNRRRMEAARRRDLMIGLDIELIVPFVPHASELTGEPEWV